MPSKGSRDKDDKSTKSDRGQGSSKNNSKNSTSEIFGAVARGLLEYGARKYLDKQQSSTESSQSKTSKSSTRSARSRGPAGDRAPVSRHGSSSSGDGTAILGQLFVGLGAFFVRQYLHRRKARKEKAKEEVRIRDAAAGGGRAADADLQAGLNVLSSETQKTSEALRSLATGPPSHPDCRTRGALVENADRLQGSLSNIQTGANNIRNLNEERLNPRRPAPTRPARRRYPVRDREPERDRNRDVRRDREREIRRRNTERTRERPRREYVRAAERPRSLDRMEARRRRR